MAGSEVVVRFLGDTKSLDKAVAKAGRQAGALGGVFAGLTNQAAGALGRFASDSAKAASDFNETVSKVGVLFGDQAVEIQKFAASASGVMGMSKQSAADAAATFAIFGKSAGLTGKDLTGFSTELTSLAGDMASFSNTTPDEAIQAIGAALRGESEPIRKYGVLLDDASMRAQALKMGLIKTTKEALTPQQKVLTAQALILQQTTAAQGDFQRTSGSLANQQKILAAQFDNVKIAVGEKLVPALLKVVDLFRGLVGWVQQNQAWLKPLAVTLGTMGGVIMVIVGAMKAWAAIQAVLNILWTANPIGIVIVLLAGLVAGIVYAWKNCEGFRNVVMKVWDAIKLAFQVGVATVKAVLKAGWDVLKRIFSFTPLGIITQNFGKIVAFFKALPGRVKSVLSGIANVIKAPFVASFNLIARAWNATVGKLSFRAPDWVPVFGGKGWDVPDLPTVALAAGGIVTKPTVALLGEGGPEAVIPLRRNTVAAPTQVVVNINGPVTDPVAAARWIREALAAGRRAGVTV